METSFWAAVSHAELAPTINKKAQAQSHPREWQSFYLTVIQEGIPEFGRRGVAITRGSEKSQALTSNLTRLWVRLRWSRRQRYLKWGQIGVWYSMGSRSFGTR